MMEPLPSEEMCTVALSITNGFAARFLLRSGVLERLAQRDRVAILSPNAEERYFRDEFERPGVELRTLRTSPGRPEDNFDRHIWQVLTPSRTHADALVLDRIDRIQTQNPKRYRWLRAVNGFVSERPATVRVLRGIDRAIFRGTDRRALFREIRPHVLVVTSAGWEAANVGLMREARRRGVPIVFAVLGWDNLTTRGPLRERPDKVIVWNEVNRDEAIRIHGFAPQDVFVGGVPHFDVYARLEEQRGWEKYCAHLGLDPDRALITVGGTTPDVTDGFDDVVEILARGVDTGAFVRPAQLLVRPHPVVYSGWTAGQGMAPDLERYRRLGRHVYCLAPQVLSRVLMADLAADDLLLLAETLRHSAVVVNFFSTLMVDSAAAGAPVVCVGFDGYKQRNYYRSVRRLQDIGCIKGVLETGGVRIADSPDELIAEVNRYLADPSLESTERAELARRFCYQLDGRSAERYAQAIAGLARGVWRPVEEGGSWEPERRT